MPRPYAREGDQLSEHITEALAGVADADLDLAQLAELLKQGGLGHLAARIEGATAKLEQARRHLRAAEAIRKEISPRRQAALAREASKRRSRDR